MNPLEALHREVLSDIPVNVSVEIGRATMSVKQILAIGTDSIIELETPVSDGVTIKINGKPQGHGEIVTVDDKFGVRINTTK